MSTIPPVADAADALGAPLEEDLLAFAEDYFEQSGARFAEMRSRVTQRLLGDTQAAEHALAQGGFVLNDCTVVMRRNPETDYIEFFCDVGLPESSSLQETYRTALELNLCRTYPGIVLGVHPESGRLVATATLHSQLLADDDLCIKTLEILTMQVRRLRHSRVIALND